MKLSDHEITQFIGKFQNKVFRTCLGFVQNTDDAADLTQDVFLAVLESLGSFRNEAQLSTWVYRIAVNKSLNHLKKKKTRSIIQSFDIQFFKKDQIESHEHVHNPTIETENQLEASRMLKYAIGKLPENQRIAFTLSKYEELGSNKIAEIMDITVSAVDSLLHRAKLNMRKSLQTLRF